MGTREEIERFLDGTDPETVHLCLDTGHVAYCGADNLALIRDYPERIRYVHLKQVDPAILPARPGRAAGLRPGRPPRRDGRAARSASRTCRAVLAALAALDRELFCIVEQDMYPCDSDVPLPIATRTRAVLRELRARGRAVAPAQPADGGRP